MRSTSKAEGQVASPCKVRRKTKTTDDKGRQVLFSRAEGIDEAGPGTKTHSPFKRHTRIGQAVQQGANTKAQQWDCEKEPGKLGLKGKQARPYQQYCKGVGRDNEGDVIVVHTDKVGDKSKDEYNRLYRACVNAAEKAGGYEGKNCYPAWKEAGFPGLRHGQTAPTFGAGSAVRPESPSPQPEPEPKPAPKPDKPKSTAPDLGLIDYSKMPGDPESWKATDRSDVEISTGTGKGKEATGREIAAFLSRIGGKKSIDPMRVLQLIARGAGAASPTTGAAGRDTNTAVVSIQEASADSMRIHVGIHGPSIQTMSRYITIEAPMGRSKGTIAVKNSMFFADNVSEAGAAPAMIAQEAMHVDTLAKEAGLKAEPLSVNAGGHPSASGMNGYYSWARCGYNSPVNYSSQEVLERATGKTYEDLHALMLDRKKYPVTPETLARTRSLVSLFKSRGHDAALKNAAVYEKLLRKLESSKVMTTTDLWKLWGHSFDGKLSLSRESKSMKLLQYYLAYKQGKGEELLSALYALVAEGKKASSRKEYDEPPMLTPEDEALLDKAWDKLSEEETRGE